MAVAVSFAICDAPRHDADGRLVRRRCRRFVVVVQLVNLASHPDRVSVSWYPQKH